MEPTNLTFKWLKAHANEIPIKYRGKLRTQEDQKRYDVFLKIMGNKKVLQYVRELAGKKKTLLVKNDFPYTNLLKSIKKGQHYLLWNFSTRNFSINYINKVIEKNFPNTDYFYFKLPTRDMSVKSIVHYHIFLNGKPKS